MIIEWSKSQFVIGRTKDGVPDMCAGSKQPPPKMKRCYWKDFDPLPTDVPNSANIADRFEDSTIKSPSLCVPSDAPTTSAVTQPSSTAPAVTETSTISDVAKSTATGFIGSTTNSSNAYPNITLSSISIRETTKRIISIHFSFKRLILFNCS